MYYVYGLYTHQGPKPQPEASKNQSLGPRPSKTLAMALAAKPAQH